MAALKNRVNTRFDAFVYKEAFMGDRGGHQVQL